MIYTGMNYMNQICNVVWLWTRVMCYVHSYIHDIIRFAPRMMKRTPAMSPNEHLSPIAGQFSTEAGTWVFIHVHSYIPKQLHTNMSSLLSWLLSFAVMVSTVAVHIYHCCYCYPYCYVLDIYIYIHTHTHIYIYIQYIYNMYTAIIVIIIVSIYIVNIWSLLAHIQLSEVSAIGRQKNAKDQAGVIDLKKKCSIDFLPRCDVHLAIIQLETSLEIHRTCFPCIIFKPNFPLSLSLSRSPRLSPSVLLTLAGDRNSWNAPSYISGDWPVHKLHNPSQYPISFKTSS